ncbi:MAG: hypothetical protein JNK60_17235, partial [Acidobacteria bacterium]|nr:hypothetical protein [Acidobacteriota bacterium]
NYVLEAGDGEFPPTVTTVDRRSVATTAGTLGQWSALLDKPLYTLRLTVNGTGGKKAVSEALLTPAGQAVCP